MINAASEIQLIYGKQHHQQQQPRALWWYVTRHIVVLRSLSRQCAAAGAVAADR